MTEIDALSLPNSTQELRELSPNDRRKDRYALSNKLKIDYARWLDENRGALVARGITCLTKEHPTENFYLLAEIINQNEPLLEARQISCNTGGREQRQAKLIIRARRAK